MAVIPLLHTTICFYGSRSGPCIPIMLPKCSDMLCVRSCESRCRGSTAYFSGTKLHRCLHQRTSLVAVTTSQCLSAFGWHCWRKRMQHYCNWSSSWLCYDVINFVKNKITANNGKWNVVVCRKWWMWCFCQHVESSQLSSIRWHKVDEAFPHAPFWHHTRLASVSYESYIKAWLRGHQVSSRWVDCSLSVTSLGACLCDKNGIIDSNQHFQVEIQLVYSQLVWLNPGSSTVQLFILFSVVGLWMKTSHKTQEVCPVGPRLAHGGEKYLRVKNVYYLLAVLW